MAPIIIEDEAFVADFFLINIFESKAPAKVHCRWKLHKSPAGEATTQYFHSLDLLLSVLPEIAHEDSSAKYLKLPNSNGTALETLVRRVYGTAHGLVDKTEVVTKVILVPRDGYLCRNDILALRMRHSDVVDSVVSFSTGDSLLPALPSQDKSSLLLLLESSVGAIIPKHPQSSHHETLKLLQKDLEMRLSFDWVLPTKPTAYRIAVVGGRPMFDEKQDMYCSRGYFEAAQALGISITVIDEPGHWLEDRKYAHIRHDFIAIDDMSNVLKLPQKIAKAINDRGEKIHGIVTFTDSFVIATAEAAEMLGFPTEPVNAMLQAHYKYEMRQALNNSSIQAVRLDNIGQLDDPAQGDKFSALQYPLILKPCRGQFSLGVRRVNDDASMRQAARMIEEEGLAEHGILLETFVDGPELDANFVLWDGQILFLEVTDNFPCLGDSCNTSLSNNFAETVLVSNSLLPAQEVDIIRSSLYESLMKLGFRSGVYHVEARMQNSSMRYQGTGDGIVDLVNNNTTLDAVTTPIHQPDVFLIEVNARPPGTGGTWSTLYAYGVDLAALHYLRAVGDHERFKALSQPFSFPDNSAGDGGGAQYWTAHCMIPVHRENIRVPDDFFGEVYQALPEIVPHVSRAQLYAHAGSVVSPRGGIGWIGYVLVYSRVSRRHVLEMYHNIAEVSKKILDDASGL